MLFSTLIYGTAAVRMATERVGAPVLTVGKDSFTRGELATVECFSFVAARNLSQLVADFGVKSLAQLYHDFSPRDLAIPRLGAVSLMVLGAAFELKNLGTIESWAEKHSAKDHVVSFITLKHQPSQNGHPRRGRRRRRRRSIT